MPRFIALLSIFCVSLSAIALEVTRVSDGVKLSPEDLYETLGRAEHVVLAESHYVTAVQRAQAQVIEGTVAKAHANGAFTTGWEFLNYTDQVTIGSAFEELRAGSLTPIQFLARFFEGENNHSYAPILSRTASNGGNLLGLNLPRSLKRLVVQGGISALPKEYLPADFQMGSAAYLERFIEAMGGHGGGGVQNYFAAQCLTDEVMAYRLIRESSHRLKFLVVGSFHADFSDGVAASLKRRVPQASTLVVRFLHSEDASTPLKHAKYGDIADYVVLAE